MEPSNGFLTTIWNFFKFLPFFTGLLILGIIKGAIICPIVFLIMTIGNTAVIIGLYPVHAVWTPYCMIRSKKLGPALKLVGCIAVLVPIIMWLPVSIFGSMLAGFGYGFFAPMLETFEAVGEGKPDKFTHCFTDGTWSTIKGSCTVVRDFTDVCFHSYFSAMNELKLQDPLDGKVLEIRYVVNEFMESDDCTLDKITAKVTLLHICNRLHYVFGAILLGALGILVDLPVITVIALFKSPYMLVKGWSRLFHDLIGREGPFLETACVPFAGLAILLWPFAVAGSVGASFLASIIMGAYAAVITYQESSMKLGLAYIVSSLAIYDEYVNDVLDMSEGSCFPRKPYRRKELLGEPMLAKPASFKQKQDKDSSSRSSSFKHNFAEMKPLKLLERLFGECKIYGEALVDEGIITAKDIKECKSGWFGNTVISAGLPAYCILQSLFRSAKANSDGFLLRDGLEITSNNRPKDRFFDFFLDPLLVLKEQIRTENFTEEEEEYLSKTVLLLTDPVRLKAFQAETLVENERRRAEISAFARRLHGITRSISRYPTMRRRFDELLKAFSAELEVKVGGNQPKTDSQTITDAQSTEKVRIEISRMFSQRSFGSREQGTSNVDQV